MSEPEIFAAQIVPTTLAETPQYRSLIGSTTLSIVLKALAMVQAEVNVPLVVAIVTHAELPGGGGKAEIYDQLVKRATEVFPDPTGRATALTVLAIFAHFFAAP